MRSWITTMLEKLQNPRGLVIVSVLIIIVTHLPMQQLSLSTDDYMIAAQVRGDQQLENQGFTTAASDRSLPARLREAFHFFSDSDGSTAKYRNYGNLPWWSSEHALMFPFRPIAAFTHWLEFSVFQGSGIISGSISLVCILMLWAAAYGLGRQLSPSNHAAALYAAFITIDLSLLQSFQWLAARNAYLAMALGLLTFWTFIRWRESRNNWLGLLSLFLFGSSLFTAEASIAILGYLVTWLFFDRKQTWHRNLLALIPFFIVVICWRLAYNHEGFGSQNIGLYVDPGRTPFEFSWQLLQVFPCIITSLITGIDALVSSFSVDVRPFIRLLAWGVTLGCAWLVRELLRKDIISRVMFVGSILAVIPHATLLSAGPRSGTFVAIGFFWVLTRWILSTASQPKTARGILWGRRIILGVHLGLPLVVTLVETAQQFVQPRSDTLGEIESIYREASKNNSRPGLTLVNPPQGYSIFYIPFEWSYHATLLPSKINALSPGLTPLTLTRTNEREFEITSSSTLAVNQQVRLAKAGQSTPPIDMAHAQELLQGLITTPTQRYVSGVSIHSGDMSVTPGEIIDGLPLTAHYTFDSDPENDVWIAWDWSKKSFFRLKVPDVGESIAFSGPFTP